MGEFARTQEEFWLRKGGMREKGKAIFAIRDEMMHEFDG